jgi:hypothetical protein
MPNNSNKSVRRNGLIRRMSSRAKRLSSRVRNIGKNMGNRLQRKSRKNNRSRSRRMSRRNSRSKSKRNRRIRNRNRRNRTMRGGAIEYSPLPCNEDRITDWNSTKQVGHETCVEYGTDGAEMDSRASGLGAGKLSDMDITATIKDAVDAELSKLASKMVGTDMDSVRRSLQERSSGLGGSQGNTSKVQGAMDPEASKQAYQLAQARISQQAYQDSKK